MEIYDTGDSIRMSAIFFNLAGVATDPTSVFFRLYIRHMLVEEHLYGISPSIIKDSVGRYHMDYIIPTPGYWNYRTVGTGAVAATGISFFIAKDV